MKWKGERRETEIKILTEKNPNNFFFNLFERDKRSFFFRYDFLYFPIQMKRSSHIFVICQSPI